MVFVCVCCRVVVLDKVTDLLLFFGKLLVVGGVGEDELEARLLLAGSVMWDVLKKTATCCFWKHI